ncbi:ATP-binding protein [Phaeobacter inhibens]|jgi:predicted KAP-like P-loop ATPase|uniref:Putative insertion sequence ATP binding protein n=1 Tax=Phaeobacter inhibens TaxID=221822 RepID=A0A2I7KGB8_9RHOB|nr:ATP-binding protein [Phaeobacter inhibens]AUR01637.1 putative insertion sequence ATP binding protein [Phaeobacter inhibens]
MIVADNETAVDLLYYEAIAKTVVRVVSEKSDEPLSVGVHGDWGAGKSSILMMVEESFKDDERVLCIRFNGWLFQGFDDAKTVLIETIVEELLFELISQRYERGSTLITSNLPFEEWTETFGTERLTGALLDRLTHHVNILEMNGESYRLNQSKSRQSKT